MARRTTKAGQMKAAFPSVPESLPTKNGSPVDAELQDFEKKLEARKRFFDQKAAILRKHVAQEHQVYAEERSVDFSVNVREELSTLPKSLRESPNFVADGESIRAKVFENLRQQVSDIFDIPPVKPVSTGFIYLSKEQLNRYSQFIQGDEYMLPGQVVESEILPILFHGNAEEGSGSDFLLSHPVVRLCLRTDEGDLTCKVDTIPGSGGVGVSPDGGDNPQDGNGTPEILHDAGGSGAPPAPATRNDILSYLTLQMEHAVGPEGIDNYGVEAKGRATESEISETVDGLKFEKGPADTPAFFDFHVLNIAFDHVWKEAIDLGILQQAETLYDQFYGTGSKPTRANDLIQVASSTLSYLTSQTQQEVTDPPVTVIFEFPDAANIWDKMKPNEQRALSKLSEAILGKYKDTGGGDTTWRDYLNDDNQPVPYIDKGHLIDRGAMEAIGIFRQKGQQILDNVYERIEENEELKTDLDRYKRAGELADALRARLQGRYSFTYYAADSVERAINYGVLLTYRQTWNMDRYALGRLVHTIPLAPKEKRTYSKRTLVKQSRAEKEVTENIRNSKTESTDSSRAEAEIVDKAFNKNTFGVNSTSTFDIPLTEQIKIGNTVTTNMTQEAQRESNETKKDARELTRKAAQDYTNRHLVEITTDTSYESDVTETGEISNPNDELTVTYLFYELQRQYNLTEHLQRMRPVALVAQEIPAPNEIDESWMTRFEWILRRVLLDDSFLKAFDCVRSIGGDRLMLEEMQRSLLDQRKIVRDLRQNVKFYTGETGRLNRLMQAAINKEADVAEDRDIWDGIPLIGERLDMVENAVKGVSSLLGMGAGDDPKEAARIRREGAKDAYERADRERRELMGRLEQETGVMNGLSKQVAEKHRDIQEKELHIARAQEHFMANILYYMRAIWNYEDPDQRFFRLANTVVPHLVASADEYNMRIKVAAEPVVAYDEVVNLGLQGDQVKSRHAFTLSPVMRVVEKTLEEICDLGNPLGIVGTYLIFPLRKSNVLTDFMMAPYVDSEFGLLDPDALGNWTLDEFQQLYCCLKKELGDKFIEIEPALKEFYSQLLQDPLRQGEAISVPTGSLFIEARVGEYPVIEDYKLLQRAADVKNVLADVRKKEVDFALQAARIVADRLGDPNVEKRIIVEGGDVPVVDS